MKTLYGSIHDTPRIYTDGDVYLKVKEIIDGDVTEVELKLEDGSIETWTKNTARRWVSESHPSKAYYVLYEIPRHHDWICKIR